MSPAPPASTGSSSTHPIAPAIHWILIIGDAGFCAFQHKEGLSPMYALAGLPAVAILLKPVALHLAGRSKAGGASPVRRAPAFGAAAVLLGLLLGAAVLPHAAMAQRGTEAPDRSPLTVADTARVSVDFTAPADTALVSLLRGGGYILAFRHGATNADERDRDLLDYADRSGQRNLSPRGRMLMTIVGKAIAALGIPIGQVHASPLWRCRDTATLAFGRCDTTSALFLKGREYRRERWALLCTPPAPGTDDVIVTHQDALMPLTTLKRDQLKEGDALVLKPLGPDRGFQVVAQIAPMGWIRIAGAAGVGVAGTVPEPDETNPESGRPGSMAPSPDEMAAPADSTQGME